MTTIAKVFTFDSLELRTVVIDGNPWFVAGDLCSLLGLSNPRSSLALLDEDEKGVHTMDTPGGEQQLAVVNEPGMYSLILRSRKKAAKDFKRWITHEVIPAIRQTGQYELSATTTISTAADTESEQRAQVAKLDLGVIAAMGDIVDPTWRESLARHTWAVYKGEAPAIEPDNRMLMTQPYLLERGISKADLGSIASVFGKRVKAAYVTHHGREPEEVLAMLNGRERSVKGYYERDRHLFDAVFAQHYSHLVGPQQLELGMAS